MIGGLHYSQTKIVKLKKIIKGETPITLMSNSSEVPGTEKAGLSEDILREICSFGAGNAAARLSKMTGKKVTIDLPQIWTCRPAEGYPFISKKEKEVGIAITTKFGLQKRGIVINLLSVDDAKKLLSFVFEKKITHIGEIEADALSEIGNILSSAIIGSLANFVEEKLMPDTPILSVDLPLAIIDGAVAKQLESVRLIYFTVVTIKIEMERIRVLMCFFPFFDLAELVLKKYRNP
jgi:chemotaxis protein CheC